MKSEFLRHHGESYKVLESFVPRYHVEWMRNELIEAIGARPYERGDDIYINAIGIHQFVPGAMLLCTKLQEVMELMGQACLPSYAYARKYGPKAELKPHTDRKSCEISVTLHLGGDQAWPFFIESANGEVHEVDLLPGDAILFDGVNFKHGRRDPYSGNSYEQLFLHYVYAYGPHASHMFEPKSCAKH